MIGAIVILTNTNGLKWPAVVIKEYDIYADVQAITDKGIELHEGCRNEKGDKGPATDAIKIANAAKAGVRVEELKEETISYDLGG